MRLSSPMAITTLFLTFRLAAWAGNLSRIPEDFVGPVRTPPPALDDPSPSEKEDWPQEWRRYLVFRRNLMAGGWIDPDSALTVYLNRVKDSALTSEPELAHRLRVYACPSPWMNAQAMADGVILVNIGMLARLESENQLALVLAHEAMHHRQGHLALGWRDQHTQEHSFSWNKDRWEKTRFTHSRVREWEADSLGLVALSRSRYDLENVDSVLGLLERAEQPWGDLTWSKHDLESAPDLDWGARLWTRTDSLRGPPVPSTEEESQSTHPSLRFRREGVRQFLSSGRKGGASALVDSKAFLRLRDRARESMPDAWMESGRADHDLYDAWNLLQRADSPLHRALFRRALAEYALERIASRTGDPHSSERYTWGSWQTMSDFLVRLDPFRLWAWADIECRRADPRLVRDSADALACRELDAVLANAFPREATALRDSLAPLPKILRPRASLLKRLRKEIAPNRAILPPAIDSSFPSWSGSTLVLAARWRDDIPCSIPADSALDLVRRRFAKAAANPTHRAVAADPIGFSTDSVAAMEALAKAWGWLDDRMDSRGARTWRPSLPSLRTGLSHWGADHLVLLSVDWEPRSVANRSTVEVMRAGSKSWTGYGFEEIASPHLVGSVFDARTGEMVDQAQVNLGKYTLDADRLERAADLLAGELEKPGRTLRSPDL